MPAIFRGAVLGAPEAKRSKRREQWDQATCSLPGQAGLELFLSLDQMPLSQS